MGGIMAGKRGLIMGLANDRSLAWGIAKALRDHGAELAFSYQGDAIEKRVRPLPSSWAATCWSIATSATWRRSTGRSSN